jgi:hypothetical protein
MAGRTHTNPDGADIPTPHVHDPLEPFGGDNWWRYHPPNKDWARPATPDDFTRAIEHNRPYPWPDEILPSVVGRKNKARPQTNPK